MMLFPFLMTVVLPNSVVRNWPAWLGVYGFLTMDRWLLWRWPTTGRFLEYMRSPTAGRCCWWWCRKKKKKEKKRRNLPLRRRQAENRLDAGIDRPG